MRKSLYINPCFVRTAHTTFQTHLFPNHPQINYLGRYVKHSYITDRLNSQQKKIVEKSDSSYEKFFENIILLNDEIFNQEYNEILKTAEKIYLDPNKTNIFSHDMFTLYSIQYHNTADLLQSSISRTISRINSLFNKINVDIYYFFNIRNHSELFPSWHITTSKELNRSGAFKMGELIQFLKNENSDKFMIKRLLDGFKFWEYFDTISNVVGKNNVKIFLYEKFREDSSNYITNFSNYLKIDSTISKKLLKNKREQVRHYDMQQSIAINSPLSLIYFKLLKNLKDPKNLFRNFKKKLINLCCLLYKNTFKFSYKDKESLKITKDNLIKQSNIIKDNLPLIKKYYKEDCLALKKELGPDIDKYNYL